MVDNRLRISPSKLEQFRLFYQEEFNGYITQESVIIDIKGEKEWSDEMQFGSAFHGIIEHGPENYYNPDTNSYFYTEEGMVGEVELFQSDIDVAVDYRNKYPGMNDEMKAQYWTKVSGYEVMINMRIDGMYGLAVHERKTTKRPSGTEYYQKSLQWRCYALATGCQYVQYDIFKYKQPKKSPRKVEYLQPPYQYFAYEDMKKDIDVWIMRLIEFCKIHNLMDYISFQYKDDKK